MEDQAYWRKWLLKIWGTETKEDHSNPERPCFQSLNDQEYVEFERAFNCLKQKNKYSMNLFSVAELAGIPEAAKGKPFDTEYVRKCVLAKAVDEG